MIVRHLVTLSPCHLVIFAVGSGEPGGLVGTTSVTPTGGVGDGGSVGREVGVAGRGVGSVVGSWVAVGSVVGSWVAVGSVVGSWVAVGSVVGT
jgi:hypothetical protein